VSERALSIEERRFLALLFAVVFTLSIFFTPFFPWINGYTGIYCEAGYIDITINGRGDGELRYSTYVGKGKVKFSCPMVLVFSIIFVISCLLYLFLIGRIFYRSYESKKSTQHFYSEAAKFMILYGILILAIAYVFLMTYRDFPVHGIEGVNTVGDLEDYATSLGCELVWFGVAFGFEWIIVVGVVNVIVGILMLSPMWTS